VPLSPDRWRALSPYLDEALSLTSDDRVAWLAALRDRDPALGDDLAGLLAEYDGLQASRYLENRGDAGGVAAPSLAGQVLGAYRLMSPIGQGGMGSVWLAERCDGRFEGRVAVKLLNVALLGRSGEERFRREGTFLARLTHPHIARLIDAGVSPVGQPYLVLEHVDGQAIDRYCDERTLGVDARLRLFLDVLEAVAHAHASLIVHRDIKPANVLVSVEGRVKLLDFGIAKLVTGDAPPEAAGNAAAAGLTREAGGPMTLQYAAPEQLAQGPVTTATDVYSLGVLLYVLLSGQHPAGEAVRSPVTLMAAIAGEEPRRLSDIVAGGTESGGTLARHAANCGTTPARLRRLLQGDLDTIVAKTLKKAADERYASVTALADDLRRFLRHEPISARPDTLRYRTARFVRRRAGAVAAAAIAVVVIAGLTAYHTNRLATERDRAQREAAKAAKVSEALTGLLIGADPIANRATPDGLTARGLLDASAARVEKELADLPDAQAEIFTVIGRMYRRLGMYDKAQQLLERALVSGRAAFGPEHPSVAQTLNDLGGLAAEKGDYQAAAASLESALTVRRALYGQQDTAVADTLAELGRIYQDQGLNAQAEPLHREALAIRRTLLGDRHGETAVSLSDVASVLRLNGDLAGAEALLRQSLDVHRQTRGDSHAMTATTLHDVGLVTAAQGDRAAAESLFRQAMDIHRKTLGDRHPLVAVTLNSLSRVLRDQGRVAEAAAALDAALAIARPALGNEHQLIAIYSSNLAAVQLARKQPEAAEALLRDALRIRSQAAQLVPNRRRIFPEDDWSVGATKSLLGAALTALGRYDEAEAMLLDARRDLHAMTPPPRRELETTDARLAELHGRWGKRASAGR
jgi:serine/threonine protein kinase/tetratricopeptide (TPR) repeat protein